jgi:signal transduction histidine kinase
LSYGKSEIRIALIYVAISVLWILFSDRAIFSLFPDLAALQRIGTIKGLAFVTASGVLLYWLMHRDARLRDRTERELLDSRTRLRALAARLDEVREEERVGLSREIHDGLGQLLTGIKIDLSLLNRYLHDEIKQGDGSVAETLASLGRLVDETIAQTRTLARQLRPGRLDEVGLAGAISHYAEEFARRSGIRCTFHPPDSDADLSPRQRLALFRIAQEALTNVARHAQAGNVDITLHSDGRRVTMTVRDDGVGVRPQSPSSTDSLGIIGMSERAEQLGGHCRVLPADGRGTVVHVEVPL